MKDGIVLHPEHGLNPSIELCIVCGEEMGIALLGNNIKGQAPHHICTGEICDNCKKVIDDGGCFIIEVEDGSDHKNDIIKASAISTGADRGVLLCSITDSGFTSIAGVISAVKDRLPNEDHKKMVFEILNDTKKEYGRYNNCGTKVL